MYDLPLAATLEQLKAMVQAREGESVFAESCCAVSPPEGLVRPAGVPCAQQRLVYGGGSVQERTTLAASGVTHGSTLDLTLRLRGGMDEDQGKKIVCERVRFAHIGCSGFTN